LPDRAPSGDGWRGGYHARGGGSLAEPVRKLLAILFADIAGYTAVMGADEAKGVRLRDRTRQAVREAVAAHGGRLLDQVGDGSLAAFESAVVAVRCARAIQRALAGEPELRVRVGVHVGDVLLSDEGAVGDGVNVASRVHGLAGPGEICVSELVWENVRNQPGVRARALGPQRLRHVAEPVEAWILEEGPATAAALDERKGRAARVRGAPRSRPGRGRLLARLLGVAAIVALALWASGAFERLAVLYVVEVVPRLARTAEQTVGFATTTDGVRIAYATTGSGPAVVHVIGWFTDVERGFTSPAYIPPWMRRARARLDVRYDGRGTGLSDRGVADFSLDARVRDLEAVVDALGLERFALFAISAGGPTAIAYAARHPERVTRIAFLASFADGQAVLADRPAWDAIEGFMRRGWASPDGPAGLRMLVSLLIPAGTSTQQGVLAELLGNATTGRDAAAFLAALRQSRAQPLLTQIRVPVLVVHASGDLAVPVEHARRLAAAVPGARLVVVDSKNHASPPGDPAWARAYEELDAFFAEDAEAPAQDVAGGG
jgi:class 3 adenylate cyclase/pimeloyl-ACP methyl ester carboxylesterase